MALGQNAVLGLALGTSLAAGYVTRDGGITPWLNELAFAPIDFHPAAPREEWSGDYGCGVQYLSQLTPVEVKERTVLSPPQPFQMDRGAQGEDLSIAGKRYPWGDHVPHDSRRNLIAPDHVGRRAPNGYGLYDMCENVHEWCADWFAADYYASSPSQNPHGPESGSRSRGGDGS